LFSQQCAHGLRHLNRVGGRAILRKKVYMETIVVTGANRGIGLALTRVLVTNGKAVVAICRKPEKSTELKELAVLHPERLDLVKCDVDHEEELAAAAAATRKRRKKLDVIFNNAGIMPERGDESILKIDLGVLRLAYETNVLHWLRPLTELARN
jgi:NAD(P)-dependent dehydrogenase (short-subunit alcohol dehydrogenase family)